MLQTEFKRRRRKGSWNTAPDISIVEALNDQIHYRLRQHINERCPTWAKHWRKKWCRANLPRFSVICAMADHIRLDVHTARARDCLHAPRQYFILGDRDTHNLCDAYDFVNAHTNDAVRSGK